MVLVQWSNEGPRQTRSSHSGGCMITVLVLATIAIFAVAYVTYGRFIARQMDLRRRLPDPRSRDQRRLGLRAGPGPAAAGAALLGHRGGGADCRAHSGHDLVRVAAGVAVDRSRRDLHRRRARLRRADGVRAAQGRLRRRDRPAIPARADLHLLSDLHLAGAGVRDRRVHRHHRPDLQGRRAGRSLRAGRGGLLDSLPRLWRWSWACSCASASSSCGC